MNNTPHRPWLGTDARLADVTEQELVDELGRRNTGAVILLVKPDKLDCTCGKPHEKYSTYQFGGSAMAIGLMERAKVLMIQVSFERSDDGGDEKASSEGG